MRIGKTHAATALALTLAFAAAAWAAPDPTDAPDDGIMGEYVGQWRPADGKAVEALAKVIGEGDGKYRVRLFTSHAWASKFGELTGTADGKRVELTGTLADAPAAGTLEGGEVLAVKGEKAEFEGKVHLRTSPTLGEKPPEGAVVLLPYQPGTKTSLDHWQNQKWKPLEDGAVLVQGGSNVSKDEFGSIRLHVEFRCPYQPKARGQGRGNSGVYLHGKYEVQVLDSFGLPGLGNECGAIYGVAAPKTNPALPPGRWQTFDIVFRAPEVADDGTVTRPPTFVSVRLNGVTIQENAEVTKTTRAGMKGAVGEKGPLMLQDHGNAVQYRNIWYVDLDAGPTPNLGAKPPEGAEVLLAYEPGKKPTFEHWDHAWDASLEGYVTVTKGDLRTRSEFGSMRMHVEFCIPDMPDKKGQAKGNSGVYIMDRYEIQVLDSYGLEPGAGDCGAVYRSIPPKVNACLPPGRWQSYDIEFHAPKFDAEGKKTANVRVTVVQNGITIQDNVEVKGPTGSAKKKPEVPKAILRLQDHGNPVRFRNVWLVPLEE